ncbi:MAG: heparinase II/III family protein [Kiritimatiellae bacterium]|nr:heparinase II/III family protein [Kiritimatiellia bacterium]
MPAEDPEPEGLLAGMDRKRMSGHPRLLFTAEELPALRAKADTPLARLMMEQMEGYLSASRPPKTPAFAKNDTDAQRHGLWRLPTLALHAVLTGDATSKGHAISYLKQMEAADVWQGGKELNSGMGAANVLAGASLAFDWLYHDLEPEFREAMRQKLILQARRMYYGGHLNRNNATGYWQGDPQNNHRWHRNAGLTLAALAVYEDSDSEAWLVETALKELQYVMRWRPEDGSYSEGPGYMIFGGVHLMLALTASDLNLGTEFQQHPFIRNNGDFIVQTLVPDRGRTFPFNDSAGGGLNGYAVYLHRVAAFARDSSLQLVVNEAWREHANTFNHIAWLALLWFDPSLREARVSDLPTRKIFRDSGVAFVRDGWTEDSAALMFRSMPIGGRKLNEYRNAHGYKYVNVAHDDPDANSFVLWKNGGLLAETSRYSNQKQSASHNTILINGMGQAPVGRRPDPTQWMQPARGKADMLEMAFFTGWESDGKVVIMEGEASGSYTANKNKAGKQRPSLTRYRRTVIWVESGYVLVLDDIRAGEDEVEMTWLLQGPELEVVNADTKRFLLKHETAECPFQVVSLSPMEIEVVESPADHRGKALGWRQLRLQGKGSTFNVVSVYDLWQHGDLRVELEAAEDDTSRVRVISGETTDHWKWVPAMESDGVSVRRAELR